MGKGPESVFSILPVGSFKLKLTIDISESEIEKQLALCFTQCVCQLVIFFQHTVALQRNAFREPTIKSQMSELRWSLFSKKSLLRAAHNDKSINKQTKVFNVMDYQFQVLYLCTLTANWQMLEHNGCLEGRKSIWKTQKAQKRKMLWKMFSINVK